MSAGPTTRTRTKITCLDCHHVRTHHGRGLCTPCFRRRKRRGVELPPMIRPVDARCSVTGCDEKAKAQHLCAEHYNQYYRFGDPELIGPRKANRLAGEEMVARCRTAEALEQGECWEWPGAVNALGYGMLDLGHGTGSAHRSIWIELYGAIEPASLAVCHRCDNPPCVRPSHLFLGTKKDNTHDMMSKGRQYRAYGDDHWNLKLSDEQVAEIHRLAATGMTKRAVARMFPWVDESHVRKIINGQARTIPAEREADGITATAS